MLKRNRGQTTIIRLRKNSLRTTYHSSDNSLFKGLNNSHKNSINAKRGLTPISSLGLETLSCKTPGMAVKELWVYLLAHNLIRMVMAQSALLADCLPRQLSFKHSLQLCLALRQYGTGKQGDEVLKLLQLIARKRVGNRPSRIEPRAVKRRPKPYPKLMQARGAARAEVRKNGHPKKVK